MQLQYNVISELETKILWDFFSDMHDSTYSINGFKFNLKITPGKCFFEARSIGTPSPHGHQWVGGTLVKC